MELMEVHCVICGMELQVPTDAKYVRCRQCRGLLEISRSPTVVVTKARAPTETGNAVRAESQIDWREPETQRDLVRYQLEQLDRAWSLQRAKLLVRAKHSMVVPSIGQGVLGVIVGCVAGILFPLIGIATKNWIPVVITPLFGFYAVRSGLDEIRKAKQYKQAERNYEWTRGALLKRARQEHSL